MSPKPPWDSVEEVVPAPGGHRTGEALASREQMLACVEREIKMRERVYPDWVRFGRMSESKAHHEIETMRAVREVIAALPVPQKPQTNLFGGNDE